MNKTLGNCFCNLQSYCNLKKLTDLDETSRKDMKLIESIYLYLKASPESSMKESKSATNLSTEYHVYFSQ